MKPSSRNLRRPTTLRRYVWAQVVHGRRRAATLGLGIVVAAVGFSLLTGAVSTSEVQTRGIVAGSFRSAYDILVRPPGSQSRLEAQQGLVAPNFESGIFGGITSAQWQQVLSTPGVEVAAPVAYLGYVIQEVDVDFPVGRFLDDAPEQLYRVNTTWLPNGGLSKVSGSTPYLFITSRPNGCNKALLSGPHPQTPFQVEGPSSAYVQCYQMSAVKGAAGKKRVTVGVLAFFPVLVAAIDPVQENKLVGLDAAITSGQKLTESTATRLIVRGGFGSSPSDQSPVIPVLAADHTFQNEPLHYSVTRLNPKTGVSFAATVNEPKANIDFNPPPIPEPNQAYLRASKLTGTTIGSGSLSYQSMYKTLLTYWKYRPDVWPHYPQVQGNFPSFSAYWTASGVHHQRNLAGQLVPQAVQNDPNTVWVDPNGAAVSADQTHYYALIPPDTADTAYRSVPPPREAVEIKYKRMILARFHAQGTFDPDKLPGFDPKSQVPLEAYRPPQVSGADPASRAALHNQPYGPTANIAGYVSQPPALLTTLKAAEGMTNPQWFTGANHAAPISTIRVRVAGVTGPDKTSLERIRRVATTIVDRTGLEVDITAGSSPQPQTIALPAGDFGRPPLLLSEGWVKKGVAVAILSAVSTKSVLLFALILVVTAAFLANAALATVRARRRELGVLLALGWTRRHLFTAVLAELGLIGLIAGLAGAGLSAILISALSLQLPFTRILLVPVVAVALTLTAGLIPATLAARGQPTDVITPTPTRRTRRIRSTGRARAAAAGRQSRNRSLMTIRRLAWRNLIRQRGRNTAAALTLGLGVAALTAIIAITITFNRAIVGSLLGDYITSQVRGVDYLAVALTLLLAALSIADVLLLNVAERAPELITLQATGWTNRHLTQLTLLEALGLGATGAIPGAAIGLTLGLLTGAPALPASLGAAAAAGLGLLLTLTAAALPARQATRGHIATALADE